MTGGPRQDTLMGSDGIDRLFVADGKIDMVDLYVGGSIAQPEACARHCGSDSFVDFCG